MVRDLRANLSLAADADAFDREIARLREDAPRKADGIAGAFSRSFSSKLASAFRSLPRAEITADSTDAEIKIQTLRTALRELSDKRIGLDIDATTALAEMSAIKAELASVAETADIDVRADVSRALAALAVVEREVEKLDGQTATVDVDVSGAPEAVAKVGLLDAALTTLKSAGPLKVAAVAGAIAALPIVATAAAGGVTLTLGGALVGLGLLASKGSTTAQTAITRLRQVAKEEARLLGVPFEQVWVTIVAVAEREMRNLSPAVRAALADVAPDVESFVDQTGASLSELEPVFGAVQRALSAVLRELGPRMPEIMATLALAVAEVTAAVEENPQAVVALVEGLADLARSTGELVGELTRLAGWLEENQGVVEYLAASLGYLHPALGGVRFQASEVTKETTGMTQATQGAVQATAVLDETLLGLARTYGIVEEDAEQAVQAAKAMIDSWAQGFAGAVSWTGAIQDIESATQASTASAQQNAQRQEAATERLAQVQEAGKEKITRAQREVTAAHQRAADQVVAAQERQRSSQESLASTVEQAARREADAVQSVEDARRRSADQAEESGRAIEAAAQRAADAHADAADQIADAEARERDSHARTAAAVEDLAEARERAAREQREQLDDLAAAQADSAFDERGAQLAIERARERMNEVNADPEASSLDRQEAQYAFERATRRLTELQQRNRELGEEIARVSAEGVEGSAAVISAKERIASAQREEQEAEEALARQRQESARSVADAESALAEARRAAARQQEDSERSLARVEAELNQIRIDGARDVLKAKREVEAAEKATARVVKEAAAEVREAEDGLRQTRREVARDTVKANEDVRQSWVELGSTVSITTAQYLRELERQVRDQEKWAENLVALAGRVPDEMLRELAELGPGGARVVALATEMSDAELQKFISLHGRSGKDAGETFARNLAEAGPVLRAIAQQHGQEIADRVRDGMDGGRNNVFLAAQRIGVEVKRGIDGTYNVKVGVDPGPAYGVLNQLLRDIGAINANISVGVLKTGADGYVTMADGAVVQAFAGGTENHIAQIAPAGAWRVWAEDETGGEAYIPLAMSKRPRSEAILADVAERFGGAFVKYATAGMPVGGGDGASLGGMVYVGSINLNNYFADDRDMYQKGRDAAAGLREYIRLGGVLPT
ncbi:hypothetical protein HerbRD11066_67460 [Herbidospora sp. RD11066]